MKLRLMLLLLLGAGSAFASTNKTFYRGAVMVDSNGVVTAPLNFKGSNDIASATPVSNVAAQVETNLYAFRRWTGTVHAVSEVVAANTTNLSSELITNGSMAVDGGWGPIGMTWDVGDGSGLYLAVPPIGGSLRQAVSGITNGMTLIITYSNAVPSTGSVVVTVGGCTNIAPIGVSPVTFLAHIANTQQVEISVFTTNGVTSIDGISIHRVLDGPGYFAGRVDSGVGFRGPGHELFNVLEPRPRIGTNVDVTLWTPRWQGDFLVDAGSNKTYTAYTADTNGWR